MQFTKFLVFLYVQAYQLCDREDYPYKGKEVVADWKPSGTVAVTINNEPLPIKVKGSVQVVDGCSFKLVNFSLSPVQLTPGFFGAIGNDPNAIRLTDGTYKADSNDLQFEFVKTAGSWVSWNDFNQFRLFDEQTKVLLAIADLPNGNLTAPTRPVTSVSGGPTKTVDRPTSPSTPTTTRSDSAVVGPSLFYLAVLAAFA